MRCMFSLSLQLLLYHGVTDKKGFLPDKYVMLAAKSQV